jgi:alpha-amylase
MGAFPLLLLRTMRLYVYSIPIVYYGQEQGFSGSGDPVSSLSIYLPGQCVHIRVVQLNREPLWSSGYAKTDKYTMIATLNNVPPFSFLLFFTH